MPKMPKTDRLQALLEFTREHNEVEQNRVSLETFLADFQQEREELDEAQLKQIQASQSQLTIYQTLLGLFSTSMYDHAIYENLPKREPDDSVSNSTQTSAMTASCTTQTDAATDSLWDLLPKAREEAFQRGLDAGKDDGRIQGIKEGHSAGMTEGLAIGLKQGQTEGLETGLEQGKEVDMQRGIEIGRKLGYADGLAERLRQTKEKMKKLDEGDTGRHIPQVEATREKIIVKLPSSLPAMVLKEEKEEEAKPKPRPKPKPMPMINGIDPFASLLGLARKK
ncbi:uncharacterized protein J4E79_004121 [Alternaria viburni]|uniref:uncharacterized protein n=1 Tax=Alternaria viburni TaxID=566460 RepID=UPI0020C5003F|nr:uncharacterized protein J4E79_004121 [Alternaria viburni]KAI4662812.1 hypothetical protein J4E79_004121 [Alternaria viburni]